MGEQGGTTGRTVMVNAYEQREDKCSFLVTVTCLVTDESAKLDGEQLLTLTQANNGGGALNWVLPGAGENRHEFTFTRYTGTEVFESQG